MRVRKGKEKKKKKKKGETKKKKKPTRIETILSQIFCKKCRIWKDWFRITILETVEKTYDASITGISISRQDLKKKIKNFMYDDELTNLLSKLGIQKEPKVVLTLDHCVAW